MRDNVHRQRQASQFTEREATGPVRAQITQQGWARGRWQPLWAGMGGGQVLRMAPRPHPRASWDLQPKGRGESGHSNRSPCPMPALPCLRISKLAGRGSGPAVGRYPPVSIHTRVGCHRHQKHAPSFSGQAGRWAPGGMEGQEPPGWFMVERGSRGRRKGWRFVQNQRYWGTCGWA